MRRTEKDSTTSPGIKAVVIGNGPSRLRFTGFKFPTVIGCNHAYTDFNLTHCVVWDGKVSKTIDPQQTASVKFYKPGFADHGWHTLPHELENSGAAAIALALELTQGPVLCWGFDGLLGGSTETAYEYGNRLPQLTSQQQQKHNQAIHQVCENQPVYFAWYTEHPTLRTVKYDTAISMVAQENRTIFRRPKQTTG